MRHGKYQSHRHGQTCSRADPVGLPSDTQSTVFILSVQDKARTRLNLRGNNGKKNPYNTIVHTVHGKSSTSSQGTRQLCPQSPEICFLQAGLETKTANRYAVSVLGAESNLLVTQSLRVPCVVAQITDAQRQMMNGRHSSGQYHLRVLVQVRVLSTSSRTSSK